jgi:hypothetical protein
MASVVVGYCSRRRNRTFCCLDSTESSCADGGMFGRSRTVGLGGGRTDLDFGDACCGDFVADGDVVDDVGSSSFLKLRSI